VLNGSPAQVQSSDFETARIVCKPPMLRSLHTEDAAAENNALCVVGLCSGDLDACVVVAATAGEHDYAWASCALREAGGLMTDLNGKAVPFNTVRRELPPVIAMSNGQIHDALLRQIAKMIDAKPAG
jgi:3'-phosphoadenosine 5'-phosphosulfate (PAPS) 3'-phosphatase